MSTERLDRSAESFDLRRAVWAGFLKSRYWRIAARIEPHAVVGAIILLATPSLLCLDLGMVYRHHRLPNDATTMNVLRATMGLLGFWYVVHQNMGFLRWLWENPWGKLAYGLLASVTVTGCKVIADQQIRMLTQSNPSLFPSSQQAITVLNIVAMIFVEIACLMMLGVLIQFAKEYMKAIIDMLLLPVNILCQFRLREMLGLSSQGSNFRSFASGLTRSFAFIWGILFIFLILPFFDNGFAELSGKPFNATEVLLLWTSFIPNDLGLAGSDRVCVNLPSDTLVSPFDTRDPIPNRVVMAQRISTSPDRLGRSYTYRVVACSKPTGPGASLGTEYPVTKGVNRMRDKSLIALTETW